MSTLKTNRIENLTTTDGGISIDNGGRVGVGTSTPGSFSSSTNNLVVSETGGNSGITLHTGTSNSSFLGFTDTGDTNNQGYIGYSHSNNALLFSANSAERLRIDSSGNVGIGDSSPSDKLSVSGGNVGIYNTGNSHGNVYFYKDGTTKAWVKYRGDNERLIIGNTSDALTIDSSGNVGIGTSSVDSLLHIESSATPVITLEQTGYKAEFRAAGNDLEIRCDEGGTGGLLEFYVGGGASGAGQKMTINAAGNVGIGTSPKRHLHVHESNSATVGFMLTNAATGAANDSQGFQLKVGSDTHAEIAQMENSNLRFLTNASERMRITSSGYAKHSNNSSYYNSGASYHEFNQSIAAQNTVFNSTLSTYGATQVQYRVSRAGTSNYWFIQGVSGSGSGSEDTEFYIRGDGYAYIDGSWNGGGADYAEYFEWSDGNTKTEDRRGISVVLDGNKIREAVAGEEPIGVISGNPSVVGDADVDRWKGKYLRDDFGTYIQEDYEVEDEDGNTVVQQRRKLNPDYNPDTEYVSREDRPEWDCVGLMGKLRIRKGQVTGARWIKMRDISDSVEEWLVR